MGDIEYAGLPNCKLLSILDKKVKERHDLDLDFFGILNRFRNDVSIAVRQINCLFPEYTPHDAQYHLKHLFFLADDILGSDRLGFMNPAELFILAIALYGHDWGMSVGIPEKTYITTGKLIEGSEKNDLWIALPDEQKNYQDFLERNCLHNSTHTPVEDISLRLWREYVRQTHAFRSAARIRKFFEPIDRGIAESAARICEGHWLEFEELQDQKRYPSSFSVLGEQVNLRALTIYVRLIDLLDLAEDRTPYILWKLIAPRDPRSKMEWEKHRALSRVTFPPHQEGRVIQVDGSTNDQDVYAALEDLRILCEEQLRGCNNILAQMNDPRHRLDIYHIEWRVETIGFDKISIRFEFDRDHIFKILGNEIYQNDPYVFLRELLQNSIDAIRTRKKIIQKNFGSELDNFGIIEVNIDHEANGDSIVTWCDNGIGMDEYIVSNYLAKVGRSYYGSKDFKILGIKMDPISRFGIGILSCFTVADKIEIETYKDPYLPPKSSALKIVIPDEKRHFRVEKIPSDNAKPGTKVRVFIIKKWNNSNIGKERCSHALDITSYLSSIAGFVEFPIIIREGNRRTIITHPTKQLNHEWLQNHDREDFHVFKLNLSFPWLDSILPQDIIYSREALKEERLDIASDLGLKDYEGVISYLVPDSNFDIGYVQELINIRDNESRNDDRKIRFQEYWNRWITKNPKPSMEISRSSVSSKNISVFKDGILIPSISTPPYEVWPISGPRALPIPRLVVNITKGRIGTVNISRTELLDEGEHWAKPIYNAFINYILNKYKDKLLALEPVERAYKLGRISVFHNIDIHRLWHLFPHDRWPLIFLESGGYIKGEDWVNVSKSSISLFPLHNDTGTFLSLSEKPDKWLDEFFSKWIGEQVLVQNIWHKFPNSLAGTCAQHLCDVPLKKYFYLRKICFLEPPWEGNPPMLQRILYPIENTDGNKSIEDILEIAAEEPSKLTAYEVHQLNSYFQREGVFKELLLAEAIEFPHPFSESFAFGGDLMNIKHPGGEALFRFRATLELAKIRKNLPAEQFGKLTDSYMNFNNKKKAISICYDKFTSSMIRLLDLAEELKLIDIGDISTIIPDLKDFIPGTLITYDGHKYYFENNKLSNITNINFFGKVL